MAILTINSGSSSLKFGLYDDLGNSALFSGGATGLGTPKGVLVIADEKKQEVWRTALTSARQDEAFSAIADALEDLHGKAPGAIGHRVVHGGPHLVEHQAITPQLLQTLANSLHFAPLHIPNALALIRKAQARYAGTPEFACFDTAFHQTMPPPAYTYPLPARYRSVGVRRYGFHGLSYESIVQSFGSNLPARMVVAHLGGGASLCALAHGQSVDTSMGFSPAGGIPMATRSGDLDPGVVLLLERDLSRDLPALTPDQAENLLNHESGFAGLAGESDMQVLARRCDSGDKDAELAVEIFCRSIAKTISAYVSVLGGLDALVFTGGIGEHSDAVRRSVSARLAFLGLELGANRAVSLPARISASTSRIVVQVIAADEDGQIARHVARLSRSSRSL